MHEATPGLDGPDVLAETIIRFQDKHPAPDKSSKKYYRSLISPAGLKQLILIAYHAGLMAEEGRFPRFRLVVSDSREEMCPIETAWPTAHFASPIPLTGPEVIRRLAPAVPLGDFALTVKEQEGKLVCMGCCALRKPSVSGALPEYDHPLQSIMVRVDGPGKMRVAGPFPTFLYKAGRITTLRCFAEVRCVERWLDELATTITARNTDTSVSTDESVDTQMLSSIRFSVRYVWSNVLGTAVDLGHGGTFVILPSKTFDPMTAQKFRCVSPPPVTDPPITLKYRTKGFQGLWLEDEPNRVEGATRTIKHTGGLGLGDELQHYWLNEIRETQETDFGTTGDLWCHRQNWMNRKVQLSAKARAFGNLSAVDGCVVLDRGMSLVSFGGEIRVDDAMLMKSSRTFFDQQTSTPMPDEKLEQLGMRHRSAFRFCKVLGHALVFVISQDGDLRVFSSDANHVYLNQDLSHVVMRAEEC